MRTIDSLLDAVLRINIPNEIDIAMGDVQDVMPELLREQWHDGKRADDKDIFNFKTGSEFYSDRYAEYKGFSHPINLQDTGELRDEIFTKQESEGIILDSHDWKAKIIKETFGDFLVFSFDTEREEKFAPIAGQKLVDNVSKELSL